jgi:hypothetical protein
MNTQDTQNPQHPNVTPAPGSSTAGALEATPAPPQPVDPATEWRVEFVKRKQRANAFFNQITAEQRFLLCGWFGNLSVPEIQQRIAAAAPEGWGLQISQTVLRRTRALYYSALANAGVEEMLDALTDMHSMTELTNIAGIQRALSVYLHQEAIHLAQRDPKSENLKHVLANIQKLSALDFKRQQLEIQREKLRHSRSY